MKVFLRVGTDSILCGAVRALLFFLVLLLVSRSHSFLKPASRNWADREYSDTDLLSTSVPLGPI